MASALCSSAPIPTRSRWRDVVMPKEHGSWSLALEPVAFGLLLVPSFAGACVGLAALCGFLARRPLKLSLHERVSERRRTALISFAVLSLLALAAMIVAASVGWPGWLAWLMPSAISGALFLFFDLKNSGREEIAEIAGAAAFAGISAAIMAAGGWSLTPTSGVLFVMCSRAVPTVMFVRSYVRGSKTGVMRPFGPLAVAAIAVAGAILLSGQGIIPFATIVAVSLLFLRAAAYLLLPLFRPRPRTLGFQELAFGAAYVAAMVVAWRW